MKKVEIRKDIYKLFEELSGKKIDTETHERLKEAVLAHSELDHKLLVDANKLVERQSTKIKEMSKIIYQRGWDAEILEKHIVFLKRLFEEK